MKTMKKKTVIITNIYTIFMLLLGVVGGGCFVVFSFLDGYNPLAIVSSAAGNAIFKEEIFSDSISGFIRIWNGKELFSSDLFLILSGISFIIVVSLLTFFLCLEFLVDGLFLKPEYPTYIQVLSGLIFNKEKYKEK
ncbi:hypothetical protein [Escherichia coli]|uniref:hypothetical protein n=1 Tax=Escherichia coli TaxID=562 RepID=UPI003EBEDC95